MNATQRLRDPGQSPWLDDIRRDLPGGGAPDAFLGGSCTWRAAKKERRP